MSATTLHKGGTLTNLYMLKEIPTCALNLMKEQKKLVACELIMGSKVLKDVQIEAIVVLS